MIEREVEEEEEEEEEGCYGKTDKEEVEEVEEVEEEEEEVEKEDSIRSNLFSRSNGDVVLVHNFEGTLGRLEALVKRLLDGLENFFLRCHVLTLRRRPEDATT
ncbi:hypothetical protein M0804_002270 [Polistes exclamans]|nr:hypothetical protein M0804_002270 [Polistes exclamans]